MDLRERYELQAALKQCTGYARCNNPPHPDTALWMVSSYHEDGTLSLSHVWAINKDTALNAHFAAGKVVSAVVNMAALKMGGGK